jgi:2-methylcitrate dehydratase PrpD
MKQEITARLAEFCYGLRLGDVPPEVVDKVKLHFLDQIGCQLIGTTLPWSQTVEQYAYAYGRSGKATLVMRDERLDAESAALSNAMAGHAFEIDDYHQAPAHPGCVAVPAAIAVAEEQGCTGEELLLGVVLGFEVIVRIAEAAWPEAMTERGFHTTCAQGVFGAAAAAGRLMKLDERQMLMAIALAGSHASGTMEHSQSGGDVKRYHASLGAAGGIRSARLAALGLTAPPTLLEGKKGFLQAFSPSPRGNQLIEKLGEEWRLMATCIKPYCCCGLIHAKIDALAQIMRDHAVGPGEIEEIVVGCDRLSLAVTGVTGPAPNDMTAAQFSTQFSLALRLASGSNDYHAYQHAMAAGAPDPALVAIAHKVRMEWDEECQDAFPAQYMAKLTVRTRDGKTYQTSAFSKGSPGNPMSRSEVEDKFISNALVVLPEPRAFELLEMLNNVERLLATSELTGLLKGQASTTAKAAMQLR